MHVNPFQILRLHHQGLNNASIGKIAKCSAARVMQILRQHGLRSQWKPKAKVHPVEEMRQEYEQDGLTLREIGQRHGRTLRQMTLISKRYKFKMRPQGWHTHAAKMAKPPVPVKKKRKPKLMPVTDKDGYVWVYQVRHPMCNDCGYVRRDRIILEEKLGRSLWANEEVWHKDRNSGNDAEENLCVFTATAEGRRLEGEVV